jgi:hypothetical protein
MKYIMVTDWKGHWDKLPNGITKYTLSMLKWQWQDSQLVDDTETVFIKLERSTKKVERAWIGRTGNFKRILDRENEFIYFKVSLEEEIRCPEAYASFWDGWYIEE